MSEKKRSSRGGEKPASESDLLMVMATVTELVKAFGALTQVVHDLVDPCEDREDEEAESQEESGAELVSPAAWQSFVDELEPILLDEGLVLDVLREVLCGGSPTIAREVAAVLAGVPYPPRQFTCRVARVLGRLAAGGDVVRLRPVRGGDPIEWSLPGSLAGSASGVE